MLKKRIYYYWKKMSEKRSRKQYDNFFFKEDLDRFNRSTNKKPAAQIKSEMNALQQYWDCYPYQYYRFDLYLKDCTVPAEEMKNYVPLFFLNNLFFPLSIKEYGILSFDKLMNYALLKAYEIPQPRFVLGFDNQSFYDGANNPISNTEADTLIATSNAGKLFVKPRFGSEGKGIEVFKKSDGNFSNEDNKALDHAHFLNTLKDGRYVVQEGLVQHPEANALYPHSINSFRVITECIGGKARVLYALIRMGKGGSQVDNAAAGGLYVKIDPKTGFLGDVAYAHDRITFDAHPDTNFVFKGAKIESWNKVRDLAVSAARKYREITYVGWDVALTTDGPSIIELNSTPDMAMIQDCYWPIRDDLKIEPKNYWYKENFTIKNVFTRHN